MSEFEMSLLVTGVALNGLVGAASQLRLWARTESKPSEKAMPLESAKEGEKSWAHLTLATLRSVLGQ